jgi:hypothetical protein
MHVTRKHNNTTPTSSFSTTSIEVLKNTNIFLKKKRFLFSHWTIIRVRFCPSNSKTLLWTSNYENWITLALD